MWNVFLLRNAISKYKIMQSWWVTLWPTTQSAWMNDSCRKCKSLSIDASITKSPTSQSTGDIVNGQPLCFWVCAPRKAYSFIFTYPPSGPVRSRLTHLWICVLTDSGATRRPRVPFPKNTSKNHWGLGVFKRKWGPSLKSEGGDQGDMTTYAHICRCISTLPKD